MLKPIINATVDPNFSWKWLLCPDRITFRKKRKVRAVSRLNKWNNILRSVDPAMMKCNLINAYNTHCSSSSLRDMEKAFPHIFGRINQSRRSDLSWGKNKNKIGGRRCGQRMYVCFNPFSTKFVSHPLNPWLPWQRQQMNGGFFFYYYFFLLLRKSLLILFVFLLL